MTVSNTSPSTNLYNFHEIQTHNMPTKRIFPEDEWEVWDSPVDAGYSADLRVNLDSLLNELKPLGLTSVMVIQGGKVLHTFGETKKNSYVASLRKSFLAFMIGGKLDKETIRQTTLNDLNLTDGGRNSELYMTATIENLMESNGGSNKKGSNGGDASDDYEKRDEIPPGTKFTYSNRDFNTFGKAVEELLNCDVYDLMDELANRIHLSQYSRKDQRKDPPDKNSDYQAYHYVNSTEDIAKIAYCMLNRGKWGDEEIVPDEWISYIEEVTAPISEIDTKRLVDANYFEFCRCLWNGVDRAEYPWLKDSKFGLGYKGQYFFYNRELDLVLATKVYIDRDDNDPKIEGVSWEKLIEILDTVYQAKLDIPK